MKIRIRPIRADFLVRVRRDGRDDLGQPVERRVAEGGEPCRDALRRALPGEALILASYCPFSLPGPYREYGPVFVLAQASAEPVALDRLPLPTGLSTDYLGPQFVLRAYDSREQIAGAVLSTPAACHADLAQLLALPDVEFLLLRFPAHGCYALRLDR